MPKKRLYTEPLFLFPLSFSARRGRLHPYKLPVRDLPVILWFPTPFRAFPLFRHGTVDSCASAVMAIENVDLGVRFKLTIAAVDLINGFQLGFLESTISYHVQLYDGKY